MYKCLFDVFRFQQYLWTPTLHNSQFYTDDLSRAPYFCKSSRLAAALAFLSQVSTLGGELTFLVISMDLRTAYTNPLASLKKSYRGYSLFVLTASIATGVGLMLMGPQVYGVSENGFVWFQDQRRSAKQVDWPKLVLFYWIIIIIYIYSVWVNFLYFRMRKLGLTKSISNRTSIMNRSWYYVVGYVLYGSILMLLDFGQNLDDSGSPVLATLSAHLNALEGVYNVTLICLINWADMSWGTMSPIPFFCNSSGTTAGDSKLDNVVVNVALEKLLLQPHMNTALRAEILYFTTQGIIFAAQECEAEVRRLAEKEKSDNDGSDAACHGGGESINASSSSASHGSSLESGRMNRVWSGATIVKNDLSVMAAKSNHLHHHRHHHHQDDGNDDADDEEVGAPAHRKTISGDGRLDKSFGKDSHGNSRASDGGKQKTNSSGRNSVAASGGKG